MADAVFGSLAEAEERLTRTLEGMGRVVVAFSGGVDSSLLAQTARRVLGRERVLAVTAVSPSLAESERVEAAELAHEWDLRWSEAFTDELTDESYVRNGADRCGRCKEALMDVLEPVAASEAATVVLGVNVDDLGDHRPGQEAAESRGARFPLVEAGFSKDMIRALARRRALRIWDKPAAPCLASRLPYGTTVTIGRLSSVEKAESALSGLGFATSRVRHYGDTARLEFPLEDLPRAVAMRTEVVEAVRSGGYRYVTLDLEGLRSGNLNAALGR